jgi:sulfur carrier protein
MSATLDLVINGEPRAVPGPATLVDLLAHLELDPRMIVVELNREIVRRPRLAEHSLKSGDSIELVHFIGGG